jgi:hypothetical protein
VKSKVYRGAIVKATSMVAAAVMAAGTTAFAQVPAPQSPTQEVTTRSFPISQDATQRQQPAVDSRRDDIRVMESVLMNALQKGAQDLVRVMQVNEPGSLFVTGAGRARGFVLDGYGIFFDVDVPGMRQSVVWSATMRQQAQERENLRQFIERSRPNSPERQLAEMTLRRLEGRTQGQGGGATATSAVTQPPPGEVAATNVTDTPTVPAPKSGAPTSPATAPVAPLPAPAVDPNELYTDAVKTALIDAMLKYSAFLKIGADEWLTVAARDSDGPLMSGQIDDSSTIMLRIKGSDLSAFQAGKLTREEVRKRVDVKEF